MAFLQQQKTSTNEIERERTVLEDENRLKINVLSVSLCLRENLIYALSLPLYTSSRGLGVPKVTMIECH